MTAKCISYLLLTLISITTAADESLMDPKKYVKIYSQCDPSLNSPIHKDNGLYYIKPSEDGPVIPVICSNGYTMLDLSLDTNLKSIPSYLSSYDYSRGSIDYVIPNLDDTSTFREWWLPSHKNTKFRVAQNCESCEQSSDPLLSDNVSYYTDGSLFCFTSYTGSNACQDNINEYSCNTCDVGIFTEGNTIQNSNHWAQCTALQSSSDTPSWHEPFMRVNHQLIYRPVMALNRKACTCYQQPNKDNILKSYMINIDQLPTVTCNKCNLLKGSMDYIDPIVKLEEIYCKENDCNIDLKQKIKCENNKIYLTQEDFKYGTYRIRECGEYIFTQDIICDFNAPTIEEQLDINFSPNRIDNDELYWFPTRTQSENKNDYPGLYDFIGSFSLGFFTGITIETANVIINLNGYTFSMDKKFYLQQRFFSLIEMGAKMFEPLQGPSHWGLYNEVYASNLEIKGPGTLLLTSHHGIHGNLVNNVYIHDLDIKQFDVAGISCNGCQYLKIENIRVGPQNNNIATLGRYTHARAFLPRLKHLNDHFGDEIIQFYNRKPISVSDLCQRMVNQMDMIYFNVINNKQYDENDKEWIAAQKIFANPSGWMDGGSSYGITINGKGAAVVGIGVRIGNVNNIMMKNIEIFGIYNKAIEKIKFEAPDDDEKNPTNSGATTRGILFDAIDWIATTDQIENRMKSQYIGDVYTDIQFAAARFVDSWYYRNSYFVGKTDTDYVFKGNNEKTGYPFLDIMPNGNTDRWCGTDIQLHSSKGAIGLMINGAEDSIFDNIYIHDIYNWADLGSELCGTYDLIEITFEDIDLQYGYSATRSHGMVIDYTIGNYKNINIENIESYYGEANGLSIYKGSDINLENVKVNNINAGTQLSDNDINNIILPNSIPRACGIDIHENTNIKYIKGKDKDNLIFDNINGYIVCDPFDKNDKVTADVINIRSINKITVGKTITVLFIFMIVIIYLKPKKQFIISQNNENTPLLKEENKLSFCV